MIRFALVPLILLFSACASFRQFNQLMEPESKMEIATAAARVVSLGTEGFREGLGRSVVCVGDEFPQGQFEPYQAAIVAAIEDTAREVVDGRECRQRGNEIETKGDDERDAMAMWVGPVEFRTDDFAVLPIEVSATRDRTFWYEVWVRRWDGEDRWMVDEAFCRVGSYDFRGVETPRRGGTTAGLGGRWCVPIDPEVTGR